MIVQVIFEGLRKCEEVAASLDERDLEFLEAACLLHSVGLFIGKKGYHKQTYRIIMVCISFRSLVMHSMIVLDTCNCEAVYGY